MTINLHETLFIENKELKNTIDKLRCTISNQRITINELQAASDCDAEQIQYLQQFKDGYAAMDRCRLDYVLENEKLKEAYEKLREALNYYEATNGRNYKIIAEQEQRIEELANGYAAMDKTRFELTKENEKLKETYMISETGKLHLEMDNEKLKEQIDFFKEPSKHQQTPQPSTLFNPAHREHWEHYSMLRRIEKIEKTLREKFPNDATI